jgi:lipopolysaccharide heptosyltransferase II
VIALHPSWAAARRLLAIRLDSLGDVLMTTPALAALKRGLPSAKLTLLTSPSGAAIAPYLPQVDEVIACSAPWVAPRGTDSAANPLGHDELALVEQLRAGHYDAAIIFTVCTQSALPAALLCRMAGIGLRLAHCRENPYGLLSHWVRDADEPADCQRHEVRRQLDLVATVGFGPPTGGLQLAVQPEDRLALRQRLAFGGIPPEQPYIVVHPGAAAASRRYPPEYFAAAARLLTQETGHSVVLAGSTEDALQLEALQHAMGWPRPLRMDDLPLGQLAALIEGSAVTLCNNSAPAHIAAAVGAPVVVLYALTNLQHTPWTAHSEVLSHPVACRGCLKSVCPEGHHACLRGVAPQRVVDAANAVMRRAQASSYTHAPS